MADDTLGGGAGDDVVNGGDGVDTATFKGATQWVEVDLNDTGPQDTGDDVDTLVSIENLIGSRFGDKLVGDANANSLRGGGGGDTLVGDVGDTLDGGAGHDTVEVWTATGPLTVDLGLAGAQQTGQGLMTLISIEDFIGTDFDDRVTGSDADNYLNGWFGDDTLSGVLGEDSLHGGGGDDLLIGGEKPDRLDGGDGEDTLSGGNSLDTFVYYAPEESLPSARDLITDLTGADTIDLSSMDADITTPDNQAFVLVTNLSGQAGEAELKYNAGKDKTKLSLDINGDGVADAIIEMSGDHEAFTNFVL
jgi:Ca2+-binding RTX toxin-like protein